MDCVCDPGVRRITLMWGAQLGKTDGLINNTIGYYISQDPKSIMVMHPTLTDLQTWIEGKLNPLLSDTPIVRDRVAKARGREGVNNQKMKSYPGGFLMFAYSGSPNTMRGRSAPIILCDEIDGYEYTNEGDPVQLLWQRSATFGDQRKLIETSTPTIKGASRIEKAYEASDQRRYYVPCPHCQTHQVLKWSQVQWDKDEAGGHLPETAYYVCEHCGAQLTDGDKLWMIRHGEWRGEKPFRGHAGFHLSELYSPFRKWRDIVQSFLDKKAAGDLQSFVNVSLAETWEESGEQVEHTALCSRREAYAAPVPQDALVLVSGVDVQDDRLELEVVGFGEGEESWSVDYRVIWGDPAQRQVWDDLDAALLADYQHESGTKLHISAACIDSGGHHTQMVYDFVKTRQSRRIFAIKGVGGAGRPIVSAPSPKKYGKSLRPVDLFTVGVDEAKGLIYSRLKLLEPGPGFCHFPMEYTEEYFAQLTAEKIVTKYKNGFPYREWIKTRPRNEALDCRVYALAALKILNPNWSAFKQRIAPTVAQQPPQQRATKSSDWLQRRKGWLR